MIKNAKAPIDKQSNRGFLESNNGASDRNRTYDKRFTKPPDNILIELLDQLAIVGDIARRLKTSLKDSGSVK